jgi:signal peptidase I
MAARFGFAAAATLAALYCVALMWNPVTGLLPAVVFVCVAVGIHKGRRWNAYGGALFLLAVAAGAIIGELRVSGTLAAQLPVLTTAVVAVVFAGLMFVGGLSLRGGSPIPWLVLSGAVLLWMCSFKPFVIPSAAMEDTVLVGDQLYVRLTGASYAPARGDVIVFRYPLDPKQLFTKRVVAIGGDRVRIVNKALLVNGVAVNEPYVRHKTEYMSAFRDNFPSEPDFGLVGTWGKELASYVSGGELQVPAGKYFVLGDNRDDSLDSRYWGFVEPPAIVGRPWLVYFSAERTSEELSNPQQLTAPILMTPARIRWGRMGRVVR